MFPKIRKGVYYRYLAEFKSMSEKKEVADLSLKPAICSTFAQETSCSSSHANDHISYYVTGKKKEEDPAVFSGDTLFVAVCGKFFEGTAEQMHQSLCVTLASLPKPTRVYCGHEYTVKNLQFALTVEPNNTKIAEKLAWAQKQRALKFVITITCLNS